jgi:starch-binding outer membrane protein, SusD/RagB family
MNKLNKINIIENRTDMKKITPLLLILLFLASSCEKFLTENDIRKVTAETYMESQDKLESIVGSAYIGLRVWYGLENGADFTEAGTDIYGRGLDNRSAGFCTYASALTGEEQSRTAAVWYELYVAVNTCNFILDNIDESPIEDKAFLARRKAEILFLRAHYYWQIVETWGGVYLTTKPTEEASHIANRSSVDEFYGVIFSDLNSALQLFEELETEGAANEYNDYGRINKAITEAFLAQMYITRLDYVHAQEYADRVINNYGFSLINSWDELWDLNNNVNSEVIWPVVYSDNPVYMTPALRNQASIDENTNLPVLWDNQPGIIQREGGNQGLVLWQIRYEELPSSGWGMVRDLDNGRGFLRWMPTRFFIELYDETIDQRWSSFQKVWICNDETRIPKYKLSTQTETGYETEFYLNGEMIEWPDSLNGQPLFNLGDTAIVFSKYPVDSTKYLRLKYNLPEIDGQASRDYYMPYYIHPERKYIVIDITTMYKIDPSTGTYAQLRAYYPINGKYKDNTISSLDITGTKRDVWAQRLANMYLIAAEAALMQGNGNEAYDYLLTLDNARAIGNNGTDLLSSYGVNSGADVTLDFILDERARELATEHTRWFDLKRTGKLVDRVKAHNPEAAKNIQEFHNLRFIPQAMLDALYNAEEFGNNPGY